MSLFLPHHSLPIFLPFFCGQLRHLDFVYFCSISLCVSWSKHHIIAIAAQGIVVLLEAIHCADCPLPQPTIERHSPSHGNVRYQKLP